MFLIARKNLFTEKTRFLISVLGVAVSVLLITILLGLYLEWDKKFTSFLASIPAELWLKQAGAGDIFHGRTLLPEDLRLEIEKIEGVKKVNKFLVTQIILKIEDKEEVLFLVGFDTENMIGRPLKIIEGKEIPNRGEIIIDHSFSQKKNLKIGDKIYFQNRDFKIVGISKGGDFVISTAAFIRLEDLEELFGFQKFTNYFVIKIEKGFSAENIRQKIEEKIPQIEAILTEKFIEDNRKFLSESFLPVLYVLSLIGVLVGTAIVGLTIYTATIEKLREFGILKAIGMENFSLYQIVFIQSLISSVSGFVVGIFLSYLTNFLANQFVPAFTASIEIFNLFFAFLAVLLMAIFASWFPIKKIAGIDPASVFKA